MSNLRFGIIGLAYDTSASLGAPGARYAPQKIRESLKWIQNRIQNNEIFDIEKDIVIDMSKIVINDFGDIPISRYDHSKSLTELKDGVVDVIRKGYRPILLGGDHSISWPGLLALHEETSDKIGIIHLDAHLDLEYENSVQGKYSGSSQIRRALELERYSGKNLVQVGVRGYNYAKTYRYIKENNITLIPSGQIYDEGIKSIAQRVLDIASDGTKYIYLTVDIDVLDSAFAPGSGANEPGGMTSAQLFSFIKEVAPYVDVIDIAEVNPMTDYNNMTSIVVSKLVFDYISSNYLHNIHHHSAVEKCKKIEQVLQKNG